MGRANLTKRLDDSKPRFPADFSEIVYAKFYAKGLWDTCLSLIFLVPASSTTPRPWSFAATGFFSLFYFVLLYVLYRNPSEDRSLSEAELRSHPPRWSAARGGQPAQSATRDTEASNGVRRQRLMALTQIIEFDGGLSRDRRPRNARDAGSSNEGLPQCRVEGPSTSDTECLDLTPRRGAARHRPRAEGLRHGCCPPVARPCGRRRSRC